jgi:hypothetical protein
VRLTVRLPREDGQVELYAVGEPGPFVRPPGPLRAREALAAAHVVADPATDPSVVDWDATLEQRRYLWSWGMGVAEAMDTAQRGGALDWPAARELIRRTLADARAGGGRVVCGVGTDQLLPGSARTVDDVRAAYAEQCEAVEAAGGQVVLMASRELARLARGPEDYASVYRRVLGSLDRPAIVHWLGPMFDSALDGYWGYGEPQRAMETCLEVIHANAAHVAGVKLSLLDAGLEVAMRRRLPRGIRMYTGDDLNFDELMLGDQDGWSDGLLGIFDGIAPAASAALQALDGGRPEDYRRWLVPAVALSRLLFEPPTESYKAGLVFLAYLNGRQERFRMLGGLETARGVLHLCGVFRLADRAGLLDDPELAVNRMRGHLEAAAVTS